MLNRGQGYRTALATATRGNGGQNEIGPELFEALGVLRTEELAAMHRFDGAEQYFTRAVDFGFSFSIEETFEKWGRDEIVGDYVRLIRMVRPDVMTGMRPTATGGGQHHQASAVLAREAFKRAGDPARYPGTDRGRPAAVAADESSTSRPGGTPRPPAPAARRSVESTWPTYDPLLGKTYAEIGTEARSMHKCQGMAQLLALPGSVERRAISSSSRRLPGQLQRDETSLFDGIDTSIAGLAQFAGARPPRELTERPRGDRGGGARTRSRRFDTEGDDRDRSLPLLDRTSRGPRAARPAARACRSTRPARYEIEFRLRQKEREFQQAIVLANGMRVEALADDGVVVPGQPVSVSVVVANRGAADVNVKQVRFDGFDGDAARAR